MFSFGLTIKEVVSLGSSGSAQFRDEHSFGMIGVVSLVGNFSESHLEKNRQPYFTFSGMNFATIRGTISGTNSRNTIAEKYMITEQHPIGIIMKNIASAL